MVARDHVWKEGGREDASGMRTGPQYVHVDELRSDRDGGSEAVLVESGEDRDLGIVIKLCGSGPVTPDGGT
jgi:hypothetical protein